MIDCKKYWLKSKTIVVNGLVAGGSLFGFFASEFKELINNNIDWIKSSGLEPKYILLSIGLLGILNAIFRWKGNTAITTKKSETETSLKEEVK